MPALGATPRAIREAAARPAPRLAPAPTRPIPPARPVRGGSLFGGKLPTQPFAPAQRAAQQRTERARPRAEKPARIPLVPNPTPAQVHAAHEIAVNYQRRQLARGATPQSLRRSLAATPEGRAYQQTVGHYLRAGHAQTSLAGVRGTTDAGHIPSFKESTERFPTHGEAQGEVVRPQASIGLGGLQLPLPFAQINIAPVLAALANAHPLPGGNIASKIGNELIDLPGQTLLSGALLGSSARRGIEKGEWKPAGEIGQNVLSQVEHPIRSFEQAPLSTALLFAGGEGGVARLAGRAGRFAKGEGSLGARLAESGRGAPRPNLKLTPGEEVVLRRYNKDPLRAALQKAHERAMPHYPGPLRQADPFQATGRRLQRELVGGLFKVGRADRVAAGGEATRRTYAKGLPARLERLKPKLGADVVHALAQENVVRSPETALADLLRVKGMWERAQPKLEGSALKTNKANLAALEAVLAHPDVLANGGEALRPAIEGAHLGERPIQQALRGELVHGGKMNEEQLRAALFPYAQAHMGAIRGKTAMLTAKGGALSNEAILAHMEANGLEAPGFFSHRPGVGGRGSFFKGSLKAPPAESYARSGEAFRNGTADYSWGAVRGNLARMASEASQLQVRRNMFARLGFKPEGTDGNGFYDRQGAQHEADQFNASPHGEAIKNALGEVVPVHVGSGQIVDKGHVVVPHTTTAALEQFGLAQHTPAEAALNGRYVLMPRKLVARLQEHETALSAGSPDTSSGRLRRGLQLYQQGFRRAKLNTSIPHQFGVMQEQAIRLAAEGTGAFAFKAGRKFERNLNELAQLDPHGALVDSHGPNGDVYREYAGTMANRGGLAGSQQANDVVRKGDQFVDSASPTMLGYLAHGVEGATASGAGHAIGAPWRAWKAVFEGGLTHVEHTTRSALLGKALKDLGLIDSYHHLIGMTDEAVKALIAGKMDHNVADALAKALDDMGGNWNRQTPAVRKLVGNYAPFGLWWLNSMRWLYRMPVTHPVKTAIAAALYNATRAMRNEKGQGFDAAHKVPGFLQGTIESNLPLVGKGHINPGYYSPQGTLGPELGNTFVSQFVPQLQGPIAAAQGVNPLSHRPLETAEHKPIGPLNMLSNVLAEGLAGPTPFATQGEKVLTRGGKPYGTANWITELLGRLGAGPQQIKPGTERPWLQVLGKMIAPTRFDFPSTGSGTGGSGGKSKAFDAAELREIQELAHAGKPSAGSQGFNAAELAEIRRLAGH